jgi:hypothetical protein
MTDLSPAAQAVLDAFLADWADSPLGQDRQCLAASLRAVANDWRVDTEFLHGVEYIRASTLDAIAAELETSTTETR